MTITPKLALDQLILALTSSHAELGCDTGLDVCSVSVLYEDRPSRDLAIRVCERLVKSFYLDLEFDFSWWKFKYLLEPEIAFRAAEAAAKADLILVSANQNENFPLEVKAWFERWLTTRKSSEGALVSVQELADYRSGRHDGYLRLVAERAHLDYLSLSNSNLAQESSIGGQSGTAFLPAANPEGLGKDRNRSSCWGINE